MHRSTFDHCASHTTTRRQRSINLAAGRTKSGPEIKVMSAKYRHSETARVASGPSAFPLTAPTLAGHPLPSKMSRGREGSARNG